MKKAHLIILTFFTIISFSINIQSQELYTENSAVSVINETNSLGSLVPGIGTLTASVSNDSEIGNYSFLIENSNNEVNSRYRLNLNVDSGIQVRVIIKFKTENQAGSSYGDGYVWIESGSITGDYALSTQTGWDIFDAVVTTNATVLTLAFGATLATNTNDKIWVDEVSVLYISGDTQLPTAPTLSSTAQTDTTADLSWTASTDNVLVTGYKVYKDGVLETTLGNVLAYQVTGLTAATSYNFTVTAIDIEGNESAVSNIVNVTTVSSSDTQAPTTPTLSSTSQTDTTVDLSWTASTDNVGVTGYRVYKGSVLEATLGNVLTYQVTSLLAATTYDFTITAIDAAGNESTSSNTENITTNAGSGGSGTGYWGLNNQDVYYNIGNVGIGTTTPDEKLTVKGSIHSEEVKVDLSVPAPDYVFENTYKLITLKELQDYIKSNKHLPGIPTAKEMETNGVELGIMNMKLLEKIEELTLYIIQQQKELIVNKKKNDVLNERLIKLEKLVESIKK